MEQNIAELLGVASVTAPAVPDLTPVGDQTPESYLGYVRLDPTRYVGGPIAKNKLASYPAKAKVPLNALSYSGMWTVGPDRPSPARAPASRSTFEGHDVYLVLGGRGKVHVSVAGRAGEDGRRRLVQALHARELEGVEERPAEALVHTGSTGICLHVRLGESLSLSGAGEYPVDEEVGMSNWIGRKKLVRLCRSRCACSRRCS